MPDVEALFREHDAHLHRTLRRRFNPAVPDVLIEDACGSAWAIAWKRRDAIPEENPVGWLVVVARNEVLGLLRQRRAETPAEPSASSGAPMADPEFRRGALLCRVPSTESRCSFIAGAAVSREAADATAPIRRLVCPAARLSPSTTEGRRPRGQGPLQSAGSKNKLHAESAHALSVCAPGSPGS